MKKPTTTRARLALYREQAAKHNGTKWQSFRWMTKGADWHNWSDDRRKIYADNRDTLGDYLGDWGQFATYRDMRDNLGFYADNWCGETIRGGVERIRTPRGTLYVPVTYCTGWDGATYHMCDAEHVEKGATEDDHDKAQREAANSAYYRAEREAEDAREDSAKQCAEDQIADARTEIHDINKQTRTLLAEIRAAGTFSPAICDALREKVRDLLADRRRCFETIAERTDNFWSAVSY